MYNVEFNLNELKFLTNFFGASSVYNVKEYINGVIYRLDKDVADKLLTTMKRSDIVHDVYTRFKDVLAEADSELAQWKKEVVDDITTMSYKEWIECKHHVVDNN
jgi:hypothetical protein